jgi:hypothetical protein
MDAQDTILDYTTRKQLIWYGHVERMDSVRLPKIMITWKPEGRKIRGRPRRNWKYGIYTAMSKRDLIMGEVNVDSGVQRGRGGGSHPPKFRSFDKAEPNSQFSGIYIHNNVIRIRFSFICKSSGTPD